MAKIKDIIALVDANKFNEYSDETKLRLVAVLDGKIAVDVLLMHPSETGQFNYTYPEGLEMEPLVHFPHDDLYEKWLVAQIDLMNREYEDYQNHMEQFNAAYENFVNWLLTYHTPESYLGKDPGGTGGSPLYYITAYGLAVKQGFEGTLEEWLASLKGEKGDIGAVEDLSEEQIEQVAERVRGTFATDPSLSVAGKAADAEAVGAALKKKADATAVGEMIQELDGKLRGYTDDASAADREYTDDKVASLIESGVWTPVLISGAGSLTGFSGCTYHKTGNLVHVGVTCWGTFANRNDNAIVLSLPFSVGSVRAYGAFGYNNSGLADLYVYAGGGTSQCEIKQHNASGQETAVTGTGIGRDAWTFQFSLTYGTDE